MEVQSRFDLRSRNWLALLALWTALTTWLILIGTGIAIGSDAAGENIFSVRRLGRARLRHGRAYPLGRRDHR